MNELFPNGIAGGYSLTSGFSVISDDPTHQETIVTSGKGLDEAFAALHNLASNFYWNCSTGNMSSFTTGEIISPSYTGYFFGYCSGEGGAN
jgi:N-methylhydantoinase B/oxoprolinase/acetone carboxylase alpha subunit